MARSPLAKYKLGLSVLGLFVVVILIIVIAQASATRQDNKTYNRASQIANSLDNYIDNSNYVPASLAEANITNVPNSITYQKLSDTKFRFCVNYKTAYSGFDASTAEVNAIADVQHANDTNLQPSVNSYLFLTPAHSKGENCQTISPIYNIYNTGNYSTD